MLVITENRVDVRRRARACADGLERPGAVVLDQSADLHDRVVDELLGHIVLAEVFLGFGVLHPNERGLDLAERLLARRSLVDADEHRDFVQLRGQLVEVDIDLLIDATTDTGAIIARVGDRAILGLEALVRELLQAAIGIQHSMGTIVVELGATRGLRQTENPEIDIELLTGFGGHIPARLDRDTRD